MIPKEMERFLREALPERTWRNRLVRQDAQAFMEFGPLDVDRLARLGIEVDRLGPRLVACMWDEETPLEVGGYLVVDNLAMGRPSMGGIRMLPDLTPAAVYNLARGMTLKNAAADLPYGGGKSGIVSEPGLPPEVHDEIVRRFARLLSRYRDIYLPGPDVGTNDADMKTVAIENGLDSAVSKPADMGGNRIDQLGAAGGGVIIALDQLLQELPRLRVLPQFAGLQVPDPGEVSVLIQGFGAVGAHAARILLEMLPGARVVGISDEQGYLFHQDGLPVHLLFRCWMESRLVTERYYREQVVPEGRRAPRTKYSNSPDDLLRESALCLIPAAPIANYLDVDPASRPTMTVDRMGRWSVIIEGANTYSPDPLRRQARARMERAVYRQAGVLIATDYLVNSGGVIFAAQERWIKTPEGLRIPESMLGDRRAVETWLQAHAAELADLADRRRAAAEAYRDRVIRRNMRELVDLLISDPDMLPCEAAERIAIGRIATSESERTVAEIMIPIPTIPSRNTVQQAAALLVEAASPILAVVDERHQLAGVITEWDITRATATGCGQDVPLEGIMTRQVIAASPAESILDVVRKLEHHEISAMPVVEAGAVVGMVTADLLARRTLLRLLQSQHD
ncbi:MAG: Glu/Leu/Phe/Val dehydrogenase dimerization domain-containing protein [Chloroflexota bacterium]